jgi:capsular polysaccharide biosynthesis protein
MKPVTRYVHDLWAQARTGLNLSLKTCNDLAGAKADELFLIQEEDEEQLDNHLEDAFYETDSGQVRQKWPEREMVWLKNVHLVGDQGHVFLEDGRWLKTCPSLDRFPIKKVRSPIPFGARRIDVPVFHLTGLNHENHGHFLFQHLPRLLAAQDKLKQVKNLHYLVAPGHRKWQERYLRSLGLPCERVLEGSSGTVICSDLYYVPQLWGGCYQLSRSEEYRKMNNLFHQPANKKGPVLFISREDAPDRRLLNEKEVMKQIESLFGPVEKLLLSQTPHCEQMDKVAQSSLIIGPQGQGMTIALFAHQSAVIILEAGEKSDDYTWCRAYRDAALMCGNQSLRLYSKTKRDSGQNWIFPTNYLQKSLIRLKALLE